MKRFFSLLLVILVLAALTLPVMADDDYTVTTVDPFTGLPLPEQTGEDAFVSSDYVYVNEYCHYDRLQRAFAYELGKISATPLYSSAPYGMVTTDAVTIELPTGINGTLYRDGVAVENADLRRVAEPGSYVVSISGGSTQPVQPLSFTIVTLTTGALDSYRVPDGFHISSVELDGEQQPFVANEASMITEGQYNISYVCDATGLGYNLNVNVDHTPPVLELANVRDGRASGPVDISDVEENCEITIIRDGKQISYNERLTQSGIYEIYLVDTAGNTNYYDFTILFYFNVTSVLFIVTVIVLILALVGYLIFTRKHLRVR